MTQFELRFICQNDVLAFLKKIRKAGKIIKWKEEEFILEDKVYCFKRGTGRRCSYCMNNFALKGSKGLTIYAEVI